MKNNSDYPNLLKCKLAYTLGNAYGILWKSIPFLPTELAKDAQELMKRIRDIKQEV